MAYKTIKITEAFHTELKNYCLEHNLKLNGFCESLIHGGFLCDKEYRKLGNSPKRSGKILITDSPTSKGESV